MKLNPLLQYFDLSCPIDWKKIFEKKQPLAVEIGFGMGEFLIQAAQDFPDKNILGIEQHWERICKTLKYIERSKRASSDKNFLNNIRILKVDARIAFERFFSEKTVDEIFCLFPCPWPKKNHVRHRLFSKDFFLLLNNCLKDKGKIVIVTDFYPYFEWMLNEIKDTGLAVSNKKIRPQYKTKFEKKWQKEGQEQFFKLEIFKTAHISQKSKEKIKLKSYKLKSFDPKNFLWKDIVGEISIILKDMISDPLKKKAMVHLVVAEQNITQHFWVSIIKKGNFWRVCKSDGQNFFPTHGILKAIDAVFLAASGKN